MGVLRVVYILYCLLEGAGRRCGRGVEGKGWELGWKCDRAAGGVNKYRPEARTTLETATFIMIVHLAVESQEALDRENIDIQSCCDLQSSALRMAELTSNDRSCSQKTHPLLSTSQSIIIPNITNSLPAIIVIIIHYYH